MYVLGNCMLSSPPPKGATHYGTAAHGPLLARRLNQTPGFLNAKLLGKFPGPVLG